MIAEEVEPLVLVVQGTEKPCGYACPTCKKVYVSAYDDPSEKAMATVRDVAQRCCAEKVCQDCGKISGDSKYVYTVCAECRAKNDAEREAKRFEKAKKVPLSDYDGETLYWEENYYNDVWELYDHCVDNTEEGEEPDFPEYVWACKRVPFTLDADRMVSDECEYNHHDEAYDRIPRSEIADLQVFLDGWCEQQGVTTYEQDTGTAVLIPPPPKDYQDGLEDTPVEKES